LTFFFDLPEPLAEAPIFEGSLEAVARLDFRTLAIPGLIKIIHSASNVHVTGRAYRGMHLGVRYVAGELYDLLKPRSRYFLAARHNILLPDQYIPRPLRDLTIIMLLEQGFHQYLRGPED
jgi:hypothetical protein